MSHFQKATLWWFIPLRNSPSPETRSPAIRDSLAFQPYFPVTTSFYLYFLDLGWQVEITVTIKNRQGKAER